MKKDPCSVEEAMKMIAERLARRDEDDGLIISKGGPDGERNGATIWSQNHDHTLFVPEKCLPDLIIALVQVTTNQEMTVRVRT